MDACDQQVDKPGSGTYYNDLFGQNLTLSTKEEPNQIDQKTSKSSMKGDEVDRT